MSRKPRRPSDRDRTPSATEREAIAALLRTLSPRERRIIELLPYEHPVDAVVQWRQRERQKKWRRK